MLSKFKEERIYMSNQVAGINIEDTASIKPHFQVRTVCDSDSFLLPS